MPEPADELQFRKAEPDAPPDNAMRCVVCSAPIASEYFHASGQVVCPNCAQKIEVGQQKPPSSSLATAVLYGGGVALACLIAYALLSIATGLELGIAAIFVGMLIGKAVRKGSRDPGGRGQQILAVALTYFAISVANVPVFIYQMRKAPAEKSAKQADTGKDSDTKGVPAVQQEEQKPGPVLLAAILLGFGLASPFIIAYSSPGSGLISLVILFFGMQRAWAITARSEILVVGPYQVEPLP